MAFLIYNFRSRCNRDVEDDAIYGRFAPIQVIHTKFTMPRKRTSPRGMVQCEEALHPTAGCGTVFSIDPKTGIENIAYEFEGGTDGDQPVAALIAAGGTLYGTTYYGGGTNNYGTVFALTT